MPTAFDILGAFSFAQGVLTLIASVAAAVFASTQQVSRCFLLVILHACRLNRATIQSREKVQNNQTLARRITSDLMNCINNTEDTAEQCPPDWMRLGKAGANFRSLADQYCTKVRPRNN
jgi:hypothetical protein